MALAAHQEEAWRPISAATGQSPSSWALASRIRSRSLSTNVVRGETLRAGLGVGQVNWQMNLTSAVAKGPDGGGKALTQDLP